MLEKYLTILKQAEAEIIEKKSKFIASVSPIKTEEEAKEFLEKIKKKYWDATHHVFAYQIGENNQIQRCSDDGEPQGTAGLPVLDVLRKEEIKNVMIIVTRYFGGTLLGTGGLVRAYGKAAKEGLIAAGISEFIFYQEFSIITDYTLSGKVQYTLLQAEAIILDTIYTDRVEYLVLIEIGKKERLKNKIIEASSGQAMVKEKIAKYGAWTEGKLEMFE